MPDATANPEPWIETRPPGMVHGGVMDVMLGVDINVDFDRHPNTSP